MPVEIDQAFLSLPLRRLANVSLTRARALGAEYAEFHCKRVRSANMRVRNGELVGTQDTGVTGLSVRLLLDGTWGFAACVDLTTEAAARVAELASELAQVSRPLRTRRIELASEPVYPDVTGPSPRPWSHTYFCGFWTSMAGIPIWGRSAMTATFSPNRYYYNVPLTTTTVRIGA